MLNVLRNLFGRSKMAENATSPIVQAPPILPDKLSTEMQGIQWFLIPSGLLDQGPFEIRELWSRYHSLADNAGARVRLGIGGKAIGKAIAIIAGEGLEPALLQLRPPLKHRPTVPAGPAAGFARQSLTSNRREEHTRNSSTTSLIFSGIRVDHESQVATALGKWVDHLAVERHQTKIRITQLHHKGVVHEYMVTLIIVTEDSKEVDEVRRDFISNLRAHGIMYSG